MKIKLFKKSHDGGPNSGVTGYWLIEWKLGFSIVILRFSKGSREAFHTHAFNALTWWAKGSVEEHFADGSTPKTWKPSLKPKFTPKSCYHKIIGKEVSWAFCIRGPWEKTWKEKRKNGEFFLTFGCRIVEEIKQ